MSEVKARDTVEAETARLSASPSPLRVCKTQAEAIRYLQNAGFKLSQPVFNRAVSEHRVPTNADGHFEEAALLGYAVGNLKAKAQAENRALGDAATGRLSEDARLKKVQADRFQLKLDKEKGLLMPRMEHERSLAARALFFKREVENFIHLHGPAIIHLVGGDEGLLPDLREYWENKTADWMNAWAEEREFLVPDADEEEAAVRSVDTEDE